MKRITIIACCFIASLMCAGQTNTSKEKLNISNFQPQLVKPDLTELMAKPDERGYTKKMKKSSPEKNPTMRSFLKKELLNQRELKQMAEAAKKERLDSMVNKMEATGQYTNKTLLEYYDNNLPKRRVDYTWSLQNNDWDEVTVYEYTWDEDGFCLMQSQWSEDYNSGQRRDYTYNEQKLGDSQIVYNYDDGNWVPLIKTTYKYDQKGRMTDEISHSWNGKDFVPAVWTMVTYDERDNQTSFYRKEWNGSDWFWQQDAEEYEYDEYGHLILKVTKKIYPETGEYGKYFRFVQEYNDQQLCVLQEKMFWNKEQNDWCGVCDYGMGECINSKNEYVYDERGRFLSEKASRHPRLEGYDLLTEYVHEYTPMNEEGDTLAFRQTLDYSSGDIVIQGKLERHFDINGNMIYRKESHLRNGEYKDLYEEVYRYDKNGRYLGAQYWSFNKDNKKLADIAEEYIYDERGNVIETIHQCGQYTGEDDWRYTNRFTYAYENDIRVEKLAYRWNGSDFEPNWGEATIYDFNASLDDIVLWVGWKSEYKLIENRAYQNDGNGGWEYESSKYYYNPLTSTSIGSATADNANGPKLRERVVTDLVEVIYDGQTDTKIYSLSGSLLKTSADKQISVSNIPAGIYIVNVNGTNIKIMKR